MLHTRFGLAFETRNVPKGVHGIHQKNINSKQVKQDRKLKMLNI